MRMDRSSALTPAFEAMVLRSLAKVLDQMPTDPAAQHAMLPPVDSQSSDYWKKFSSAVCREELGDSMRQFPGAPARMRVSYSIMRDRNKPEARDPGKLAIDCSDVRVPGKGTPEADVSHYTGNSDRSMHNSAFGFIFYTLAEKAGLWTPYDLKPSQPGWCDIGLDRYGADEASSSTQIHMSFHEGDRTKIRDQITKRLEELKPELDRVEAAQKRGDAEAFREHAKEGRRRMARGGGSDGFGMP